MRTRTLLALAAALLVFAALFSVCKNLLSSATYIEAVVELEHRDRLQVFYSSGSKFIEQDSVFSAPIEPGQVQTAHIRLGNAPMRKLRLDPGDHAGTVRLRKLTVAGVFAPVQVLLPEDIHRLFRSSAADTVLRLRPDTVEITTGADPQLICATPLLQPPPLLLWSIPLLLALLVFTLVQQTDFSSLPSFADLRSKRPSTGGETINALDGLRAVALLMVIADHTWGVFSGLGRSGVWIFMTLSGFLIARPFVQQPERVLSPSFLSHFFLRRAKRILPVYYTYIVFIFLMNGRFEEALLHALFLKGLGHLWVVPQEMLFYLLTPPVMLLCWLLFRLRPWLVPPVLLLLVVTAHHFSDRILLLGCQNEAIPFCFGVFLGGILTAWLHHFWQQISLNLRRNAEPLAAGAVIVLLLFFLFCTEENLWGTGNRIFAQIYFPWFALAAALLIFAALAAGAAPALRFLAWKPLRAVSLVSFSIYIFHPLWIEVLRKIAERHWEQHLTGLPLFMSTLLCSYLFACITYSLLERPFLRSA